MLRRIRRILLICNSYDSFSLEEDGHIEAQISKEYADLNLSNPPSIERVESTIDAMELIKESMNEMVEGTKTINTTTCTLADVSGKMKVNIGEIAGQVNQFNV